MDRIICGTLVNTHGVRGEVKIKSLLDDGAFQALPEIIIGEKRYKLLQTREHKGHILAFLDGVSTVEQAMALKGKSLFCAREHVPLPEGGYFYGDIYGFSVFDARVGRVIGTLRQVRESPGGNLYIIDCGEGEILVPAVDAFKRGVDFEAEVVKIETIYGMLHDEN